MNAQKLKEIGIALITLILQVIFFRHLQVFGMRPQVILIVILWYMARRTRTAAILLAAGLGLAQDALLDQWGLNMFSKTLTVFILYNWVPERSETQFQFPRIILTVFAATLLHNIFVLGLSSMSQLYSTEYFFWKIWIGNSIYTTVVAGIIQLFRVD